MERLRVLVVDDEAGMRTGSERVLRDFAVQVPDVEGELRFAISEADSGERALECIAAERPDLVLLDHKLPGITGLDVLERVSDRTGDMLVIMITAYASIETAVTATKRGAYDFLPKPFTPNELRAVVSKAASRLILGRQARRLQEEKRQVRFEFIRVLGHELKAPLGAVEGYLNIMQERTLGSELAAYGEIVDRSLTRLGQMRKLILDLLDMTRVESGQKQRDLIAVNVREVAGSAVEAQRVEALRRGITLALHAPDEVRAVADRGELEIILNNLVSNAVKYNRDGGRVDVTLAREGDLLRIAVADTGIGMTPEEQGRLFGEFARIHNRKTKNILGTGLGLAILKRLVQLYDGEVKVESTPDVGTTFTVTLHSPAPAG